MRKSLIDSFLCQFFKIFLDFSTVFKDFLFILSILSMIIAEEAVDDVRPVRQAGCGLDVAGEERKKFKEIKEKL